MSKLFCHHLLYLFQADSTVKESDLSKSEEQDEDEEGKKKVADETTTSSDEKAAPSGEGDTSAGEKTQSDESVVSAQGCLP